MTRIRLLVVCVAFALMLPIPVFAQSAHLPLSGVNDWELRLVGPSPYNVFDTLHTGMEIRPGELDPADSIQLFSQYGDAHRFPPNLWVLAFEWMQRETTQIEYVAPDEVLIDFRVAGWQNLQQLEFSIFLDDTSGGGVFESTSRIIETLPTWQTVAFDVNWSGDLQFVHLIRIQFGLWAPDSIRVGLEILLNDMRFVYANGDTIIVDDFGDERPTSVTPLPTVPTGFVLHQNYPNPFNPSTVIRYEVLVASEVKLQVYDLLGQLITTLVDEEQSQGVYEADFDGTGLASGTYIYALSVNNQRVATRKMLLIK